MMISSPNETVLVEKSDAVATISINRPNSLNALNDDVVTALIDITEQLKKDTSIRCVVLTGVGDYFIAGGDVKRFQKRFDEANTDAEVEAWFRNILGRIHTVAKNLNSLPVPIIGAVKGAVAGAGFSLMLGCDLVIAAEKTIFTLAYCHLGTSPDGGSTWHLPQTVGMKRAMEIALLGDRFGPDTALQWGLINQIVPRKHLEDEIAKLSHRLASGPTHAYGVTKSLLLQSGSQPFTAQLEAETEGFVSCALSSDFQEGVNAFVTKRKADFNGE